MKVYKKINYLEGGLMNRNMDKKWLIALLFLSFAVVMTGCSSGGGGDDTTTTSSTTTISGKVELSSLASSKPVYQKIKYMAYAPKGKPGSKSYKVSKIPILYEDQASLKSLVPTATYMTVGTVSLYNSDHPEWLYPVAVAIVLNGDYELSTLVNSSNNGNAYTDGDPIPAGNYTLIADGNNPLTGERVVAVKTIVEKFEGSVDDEDLVAQPSDIAPIVSTMFGLSKNTDGTQTWGSSTTVIAPNTAIQVIFSMAMARQTVENGILITDSSGNSPNGYWAVSADWLSATYYLNEGETLADDTYTVTVIGDDYSDSTAISVKNVYGNALEKTAIGTFVIDTTQKVEDTVQPMAEWLSPTLAEMASPVDVTKPIRIRSNEVMDVNGLLLEATPSLGAKPGVLYLGQDESTGLYEYEFILGEPLQLGTTYTLTVSGGKDLAGNVMVTLDGSLITQDAAQVDGVDETATEAVQDSQAKVKDVFGRWVRAMTDRNLSQLQSLMSGDFILEYDTAGGIDSKTDKNRDGKYSMNEFSGMISEAFVYWDYCGTSMTGAIIGNINVVADTTADFEFTLTATSENSTQECSDVAPDDSLYLTLNNVNGAWLIVRASEGIDTRDRELVLPDYIALSSPTKGEELTAITSVTSPVTLAWTGVSNVTSYVVVLFDSRDPEAGFAVMVPSSTTSIDVPVPLDANGMADWPTGYADASDDFGFERPPLFNMAGAEFNWEVIGFGTTTVSDYENDRIGNIFTDISAISSLWRFKNPGTFQELGVTVQDDTGAEVTFNEMHWGYDVGSSNTATLIINTPNADTDTTNARLWVSGHSWKEYPIPFSSGQATVQIDLFEGWNWIGMEDGAGLWKDFSIQTTGGIAPVFDITSVVDDTSTALCGDGWGYYDSTEDYGGDCTSTPTTKTGATSVTISGTLTDTSITGLDVNVWNESGANSYRWFDISSTPGSFTVTVDVYLGDNWISIGGINSSNEWYGTHLGIYTDTGSVYTPPVTITAVLDATKTDDYGNSSNWDASLDADNIITIEGILSNMKNGSFNAGSEGGWEEGTIYVNSTDGSFSFPITVYNGWNYVNLHDSFGNWYGLNIYTSAGEVVIRPEILTINSETYDGSGTHTTDLCYATIIGNALPGKIEAGWDGYDGTSWYWEWQPTETDSAGSFTVTLPLVSGTDSYNYINIYDENWNWTGVDVTTTDTSCTYTEPVLTTDTVEDAAGTGLTPDSWGIYNAGSSLTVTVSGTSSHPGRTIAAMMWTCGGEERYTSTSSLTANTSGTYDWSISDINVYGEESGMENWINISDGFNWDSISVYSTNGVMQPESPLEVSVSGLTATYEGCGYSSWDAGTALTATITGITNAPDGEGWYWANMSSGTFTITSGSFSFDVTLYDGYNWISVNDTDWNYHGLDIYTTNGVIPPKIVEVTSPAHNDTVSGTVTVTAATDTTALSPVRAHGYVSDDVTMTYTEFSSDKWEQENWGAEPLTLNADGTFSFTIDVTSGNQTRISVDACNEDWECHGNEIVVNNTSDSGEMIWKPGSSGKGNAETRAHKTRILKSLQRSKAARK